MEAFEPEWQVTRKAGTVYVDLSRVARLAGADTEAIVAATEDVPATAS